MAGRFWKALLFCEVGRRKSSHATIWLADFIWFPTWSCHRCWAARSAAAMCRWTISSKRRSKQFSVRASRPALEGWSWRWSRDRSQVWRLLARADKHADCLESDERPGASRACSIGRSGCGPSYAACLSPKRSFAAARMFRIPACRSIDHGARQSCRHAAGWARARAEYVDRRLSFCFSGIRTRCARRCFRRAWKAWRKSSVLAPDLKS